LFEQASCQRGAFGEHVFQTIDKSVPEQFTGLATVLQTFRFSAPAIGTSGRPNAALGWSAVLESARNPRSQGLMGWAAKSALRWLRGTAPGTTQKVPEKLFWQHECALGCMAVLQACSSSMRRRRNMTGQCTVC
jgi:hypothetical protein